MNLIDIFRRKDPALKANSDVNIKIGRWGGKKWRGLELKSSERPQLVLRNVAKVHALKSRPRSLGWYASGPEGGKLSITLAASYGSFSHEMALPNDPELVELPWPADCADIGEVEEISLHFDMPQETVAQLYIQAILDRQVLYDLAKGKGVEIGPGPRPQIHSAADVDIVYVEEKTGEYWASVYDRTGKRGAADADWSKYYVGQASDLPVEDASLDFIFSSHVFEHLANPIGHLLHWKKKLKSGGVVLAVVPNMDCTKDWNAAPTTVEELRGELREDIWTPDSRHYKRFGRVRGNQDWQRLMREKISIHVHFYDEHGISDLLQDCVNSYGFSRYELIFSHNHKDFYFALWT